MANIQLSYPPESSHPLLNNVLLSFEPHPSLAGPLSGAFGKLIGSWDLTMTRYPSQDKESEPLVLEGEWHFGWVLNGLAMQDVWIVPKRSIQKSQPTHDQAFWMPVSGEDFLEYGTTMRFFVPGANEYRAVWAGPRQGKSYLFTAQATEGGLEMLTKEGESDMKWCLTEIGEESFKWNEWIRSDGVEWWVREEFSCRRMK
jgi:hypothetical protein